MFIFHHPHMKAKKEIEKKKLKKKKKKNRNKMIPKKYSLNDLDDVKEYDILELSDSDEEHTYFHENTPAYKKLKRYLILLIKIIKIINFNHILNIVKIN